MSRFKAKVANEVEEKNRQRDMEIHVYRISVYGENVDNHRKGCTTCEKKYPLTDGYHRNRKLKDGVEGECRGCRKKAREKTKRERPAEEQAEIQRMNTKRRRERRDNATEEEKKEIQRKEKAYNMKRIKTDEEIEEDRAHIYGDDLDDARKCCGRCGKEIELAKFGYNRSIPGGFSGTCPQCLNLANEKFRERRDNTETTESKIERRAKEKASKAKLTKKRKARTDAEISAERVVIYGVDIETAVKKCLTCGKHHALADFGNNRAKRDGFNPVCRPCIKHRDKKRRIALENRTIDELFEVRKTLYQVPGTDELRKPCSKCNGKKLLTEFYSTKASYDGLYTRCKTCMHGVIYKRIDAAKIVIAGLKHQQRCVTCGTDDTEVLEFAHLDREQKYRTASGNPQCISTMLNESRIRKEATLTKFLCRFCHRLETRDEYVAAAAFRRLCQGNRYAASYKRHDQFTAHVLRRKLEHAVCTDCPRKVMAETACGFDYDHVRGKKVCSVSSMCISRYELSEVDLEIAKCEMRCANCHRKVTNLRLRIAAAEKVRLIADMSLSSSSSSSPSSSTLLAK